MLYPDRLDDGDGIQCSIQTLPDIQRQIIAPDHIVYHGYIRIFHRDRSRKYMTDLSICNLYRYYEMYKSGRTGEDIAVFDLI